MRDGREYSRCAGRRPLRTQSYDASVVAAAVQAVGGCEAVDGDQNWIGLLPFADC